MNMLERAGMAWRWALPLLASLLLLGCANPRVQQYAAEQPKLDMRQYFVGELTAWGMFQKRSGEVVKRFKVDIHGRMEGTELVLDEHFLYSDGTRQQRVWRLSEASPGQWRGVAGDVVGEALGEQAGNALQWRYTLKLPVDDAVYEVQFDDWMYLIDPETMVNRSSMRKFGVELGQVTLFFRKVR
ncbi:DUF3833 domain-containing protein [Chitinimonas sp.]|uniref:DUF3833 domain-containing protein n=1 Tax=Chitinimonas sp. TaxID=1934313 RepID=UPI002F92E831